ncbi:MAG: hypothetical protein Q9168_003564 [Polycauliona sp. 1 TL-2023]
MGRKQAGRTLSHAEIEQSSTQLRTNAAQTEGLLVRFDNATGPVEPYLGADLLAKKLYENLDPSCAYDQEFTRCQFESIAGRPWSLDSSSLLNVEANMKLRKSVIQRYLDPTCWFLTTSVTMQPADISQARRLNDQLIPLAPIMMALTASSTIWNGILADTDARFNIGRVCLDNRTVDEVNSISQQNGPSRHHFSKAKLPSNGLYMSEDPRLLPEYNDTHLTFDREIKHQLEGDGMDERLAHHFAHLFSREPAVVFSNDIAMETPTEHLGLFDAFQSTNWHTVRFKPPPSLHQGDVGWRVEFRPMEVQMTDFENAAFAVFIMLLSRTILHFDLNLYMPISLVNENMETAHQRDAVNVERFYFRANPLLGSKLDATMPRSSETSSTDSHDMMTPEAVWNGAPESISTVDSESSTTGGGNSSSNTSLSSLSSGTNHVSAEQYNQKAPKSLKRTPPADAAPMDHIQTTKRSRCTSTVDGPGTNANTFDNSSTNNQERDFPTLPISTLINGPSSSSSASTSTSSPCFD